MMRRARKATWFAILAIAATAVPQPLPAQVVAATKAERILSIGGDVTEILYALGQQQRIVAVDSTSQFPADALKEKKNVGYMRALAPEGVLSVGADLIVASDRAGPADVVKALKAAARYVEVPEGTSAEGATTKIRAVAKAVGADEAGEQLATRVAADLAALEADRRRIAKPMRALFVLNAQAGRVMVGGGETSADAILRLAGLENAASELKGFKPVGDEALLAMAPEFVVVMRSSGDHETATVPSVAGLAASPAGKNNRFLSMDGLYLLGFGPRVASAARDLMREAYPALGIAKGEAQR